MFPHRINRYKDFMCGILIGLSLTFIYIGKNVFEHTIIQGYYQLYAVEVPTLNGKSPPFQPQTAVRMGVFKNSPSPEIGYHNDNDFESHSSDILFAEDDLIARELRSKVRVLIWIMTTPENLKVKAQAIKETWAKRCNIAIYVSSETNDEFPTVGLQVPEGREHLTGKTMAAFRYVYENYLNEADWFMKADDDTYIILENLRFFLSDKDPNEPLYFGHLFKRRLKHGYYSGGSGYVISKESLHRFGKNAVNSRLCREDGGDEDVEFSLCMEKLNVTASKSLDNMGRSLFHPQHARDHILGTLPSWHYRYTSDIVQKGFGVSKYAISFHYIPPDDMRTLDYYFYHIRPYGIHSTQCHCNRTPG